MRRLAQFVRLLASRVCLRLSTSVCVCLSRVCLASAHVKGSECSRLASVSRLCASVHVKGSECLRLSACVCVCVCVRLLASASRVSSRLSASVCVKGSKCVRLYVKGFRMLASASVCVYVRLRLCASASAHVKGFRMLASVCVGRRSSCLASVCPCECLRELAHFMRRSSFKEFKRFLLSSYYPLAVFCERVLFFLILR